MKHLLSSAVAGTLAALSFSAAAAPDATANFTVSATLAAKCENTTSGTPDLNFGEYTAFQETAQTPATPVTLTFRCTRNLFPASATLSQTSGVLAGVRYTVSITSGTRTTTGAAPGTNPLGTPDVLTYVINGSMAAGQAGDKNDTNVQDSLTLTLAF